ncbi:MAG TPA: SgcJ/EcaC family oxidoreductase [Planctomycetaceae bacterium]|nr:SgcJ/EcaC family oxidoreductase [Planctomycetaceae bacterium]
MTDDEQAIRDLISTWLRASAAGDTATVLSLMADDVVFLVPGTKPFGKKEFAEAHGGLAQFRMEATSYVREVHVTGDWAYCRTELTVVITPIAGGSPIRRSGPTLSILRKLADDRWVLARDANMLTVEAAKP